MSYVIIVKEIAGPVSVALPAPVGDMDLLVAALEEAIALVQGEEERAPVQGAAITLLTNMPSGTKEAKTDRRRQPWSEERKAAKAAQMKLSWDKRKQWSRLPSEKHAA